MNLIEDANKNKKTMELTTAPLDGRSKERESKMPRKSESDEKNKEKAML